MRAFGLSYTLVDRGGGRKPLDQLFYWHQPSMPTVALQRYVITACDLKLGQINELNP